MEWIWGPTRYVYRCGAVDVGAIFAPIAMGEKWRWRLWVTGRAGHAEGTAPSAEAARAAVETRFADFLDRAWLTSKVSGEAAP
ncbi:hypothetical protein [Shinella sp.]|jgi:hypothetical protein|uniref:hypothetical protein n=1 Tax=Shinella sp. TaxID=1870904 RepID=UPI003F72D1D3